MQESTGVPLHGGREPVVERSDGVLLHDDYLLELDSHLPIISIVPVPSLLALPQWHLTHFH